MSEAEIAVVALAGAVILFLTLVFFWLLATRLAKVVDAALQRMSGITRPPLQYRVSQRPGREAPPQAALPPNPSADPTAPADPARSTE